MTMRMPNDPQISVVIPVHNRQREIHDSLNSVMVQTVPVLEVIVVDDGSTDDTVNSVRRRVGDPVPIRVIEVKPNRGGGHARNTGIDLATGRWLALLDSDDCWRPDKLERQIACLSGISDDVVCFTNLAVDRHDGNPLQCWNTRSYSEGDDMESFILSDNQAVQTSTLLMPTRLARRIRFDERLRRHQDIDFVLRLQQAGARFFYVNEAMVTYSADPAAARVSKRSNASPSLNWMEIAQAYTPDVLLSRFYAREVFGMEFEEAPVRALGRLASFAAQGNIPVSLAMRVAMGAILPARAKGWAKALAGR